MKVIVRLLLFFFLFLLGGYNYIYANSHQERNTFISEQLSTKSGEACGSSVSHLASLNLRNYLSPKKRKVFCIYDEESESDNVSLAFSKKKSEIINYFNIFCPQNSEYSHQNIARLISFPEHFFLRSSHRQVLLQVIRI